jgi:hypothetical protein
MTLTLATIKSISNEQVERKGKSVVLMDGG